NLMLGHVESALAARHASETRVRQFVADASHELRTPLAAISGYAQLTRRTRDQLPDDLAYAMGRVESESARMTSLVEDLLLLARLDSGRPLTRESVDLSRLAVDAVSDAHVAAPDHEFALDLPDEPVNVAGDAARLHQVLANLLANARIHTPAGTRVVTRLEVDAPSGVRLIV
nr:histidine kinase dimerization/phospho-acceptor domain-containing protein [Micromonospora sp. DSM 115978]